jgi:autotransporter-associated beta strand protein
MQLSQSTAAMVGASPVKTVAFCDQSKWSFYAYSETSVSSSVPGAVSVAKNGPGTLKFLSANTYSGTTFVNSGILSISEISGLPGYNTNGRYSVESGAAIAVQNAFTDANVASMLGTTNFKSGALIGFDTSSGDRTYSAAITNTAQGALGLAKIGLNTLTISSNVNTYTGATKVLEGGLATSAGNRIPDGSAVEVASGAALSLGGSEVIATLSGGGTVSCGANSITFSSTSSEVFSGTLTATGGTLFKTGSGTQTLSGTTSTAGTVFVGGASNGILSLSGTFTQTTTASPRNFQITNSSGQTGTVNFLGNATITGFFLGDNPGGTSVANISGNLAVSGESWCAGSSSTININGGSYTTSSLNLGGGGVNNSASTSILNINSGSVLITGTLHLGRGSTAASSTINLNGGSFSFNGWNRAAGTNVLNFNGGTLLIPSALNNQTLSEVSVNFYAKSGGAVFSIPSGTVYGFSCSIVNAPSNGGGGLTKTGAGTLVLGRGSTYIGQTVVSQGILRLGGTVVTSLPNCTISNSSSILNNSVLSFGSNSSQSQATAFPEISGTGIVEMNLPNNGTTVTLSKNNTYSGGTIITLGVLAVSNPLSLGSGNIKFSGGILEYSGIDTDFSSRIKNSSSAVRISTNGQNVVFTSLDNTNTFGLIKTKLGKLTLSGAGNNFTGPIYADGGTLEISGTLSTTSQIIVSQGVANNNSNTLSISGQLTQTVQSTPRSIQAGLSSGITGTINIEPGATVTSTGGMMLGDNASGNGILNVNGGSVSLSGQFWFSGPVSIANFVAGTFSCSAIYIGGGSGTTTSTLNLNGSTLTVSGDIVFGTGGANATTTINLNQGTLTCNSLSRTNGVSHTINFNGGEIATKSTFTVPSQFIFSVKSGGVFWNVFSNTTVTVPNSFSDGTGGGGLTKKGAGSLVLNGSRLYTGATQVQAGSLIVGTIISGTAGKFSTATFTASTLTIAVSAALSAGDSFKLFTGSTTNTYSGSNLVLTGSSVPSGSSIQYDSATSTFSVI